MDTRSEARPETATKQPNVITHAPSGAPSAEAEVSELMDQAKQTASETASDAGNMIRRRVDEQYHRLGKGLDDFVKNMNQAANNLDQGGSKSASNLMHSATHQIERVNGYVQRTSADDVLSDANRYARQHPWTIVAAGAVLGLAASRFLKAAMSDTGAQGRSQARSHATGSHSTGYQAGSTASAYPAGSPATSAETGSQRVR